MKGRPGAGAAGGCCGGSALAVPAASAPALPHPTSRSWLPPSASARAAPATLVLRPPRWCCARAGPGPGPAQLPGSAAASGTAAACATAACVARRGERDETARGDDRGDGAGDGRRHGHLRQKAAPAVAALAGLRGGLCHRDAAAAAKQSPGWFSRYFGESQQHAADRNSIFRLCPFE